MALPTSRDITLNPADPWPSALGNKLQDCIVGDKHPLLEHLLGPGAWSAEGVVANQTLGDQWTTSTVISVNCGLPFLRPGDRIVTFNFFYVVGAAGSITYRLKRRDMTAGGVPPASVVLATGTDNTNAGTLEIGTLAAINHVVQTGWTYWLQVQSTNAATVFYGGSLAKDRL